MRLFGDGGEELRKRINRLEKKVDFLLFESGHKHTFLESIWFPLLYGDEERDKNAYCRCGAKRSLESIGRACLGAEEDYPKKETAVRSEKPRGWRVSPP